MFRNLLMQYQNSHYSTSTALRHDAITLESSFNVIEKLEHDRSIYSPNDLQLFHYAQLGLEMVMH